MPDAIDLDHTSFGVHDALAAARWARRELGATPVFGEVLPEFRYLLMHVGDESGGGRIEFMDPVDPDGFLGRFLGRRGERPHHLTWMVPDVVDVVEQLRAINVDVIKEDFSHPPWREAFVPPDSVHRVVIQLGDSDRRFPEPRELLASRDRPPHVFPSNRGASGHDWWTAVWDEEPRGRARLTSTTLISSDLTVSDRLFGGVLQGRLLEETATTRRYAWPRGQLMVRLGEEPGVAGLTMQGGPNGLTLAHTPVTREDR